MRHVTIAVMLVSCLVFQGCVRHHARPHETHVEPQVVHHVVTPAPAVRHEVRQQPAPHHPAPKPHVVHARPDHKPQMHHNGHKASKPGPRPHSGNGHNDSKHVGQSRHRN